jgi:hypothetical protein
LVRQFVAEKQIPMLGQAQSSSDIVHTTFSFQKLKKEGIFSKVKTSVKKKVAELLKALSQNDFSGCFEGWKVQMKRCIASNRNYFERDNI